MHAQLLYCHEGSGYGNLIVGMYVLMQFWSSLVQQEGSEDDAWLGLG